MNKAEIARAWDLFRIGALAEAESSVSYPSDEPETLHLLLWIALRRGDALRKREYGSLLAQTSDANLAAVGRAHENVARITLELDTLPWLMPQSRWAQAEVAYARALIAFTADRGELIRSELSKALPQSAEQRVRYAQLRAWAKALRDDFASQAQLLSYALSLAIVEHVDTTLAACIAESLAHVARELELREIGSHVDHLLQLVQWPVDATQYEFHALLANAWRKSAHGEWISAMRLLDRALLLAPDDVALGLIHADRARISRYAPEPLASGSSCTLSLECFSKVNWSNARYNDTIAALSCIDVLSMRHEAAHALFHDATSVSVSKMSGAGHGRRLEAFTHYAQSHLHGGELALAHAQTAYTLFKQMKYVHRAADCAVRAVELGGGVRWRVRAERLLAGYPRSLCSRRYVLTTSPFARIQGRRRQVLDLFAQTNLTKGQIAAELGVAESTVRDHIRRIYNMIGVENRAQLVRMYLAQHTSDNGVSPLVVKPREEQSPSRYATSRTSPRSRA